jgi:hypothetical protein
MSVVPVLVLLSLFGQSPPLSNGHKVAIHHRGREQHLQQQATSVYERACSIALVTHNNKVLASAA